MRTNISTIFIRTAFRQHPDKAQEVLATANEVADHADAFAELDYNIFRGLAFASGNPIYGLILNGMKGLYTRIGRHYFANPERAVWRWASTTNCRRCAVKARTIRCTKQCVAMGMRVARFGTGCRKICRVI
ncbi:fatty acid metabolism regulator protein [Escherichia coli]|nr:fatty acid metabolism regulator protein [Escherichia coli]